MRNQGHRYDFGYPRTGQRRSGHEPERRRSAERPLQQGGQTFTIGLLNMHLVQTPLHPVVIGVVDSAFSSAATQAGLRLVVRVGDPCDCSVEFSPEGRLPGPCQGAYSFGLNVGIAWIGAHEDLMVCGTDPQVAHDHVFSNTEELYGHFVANTCVHELGHVLADLPELTDLRDAGNYMHTGNLPPEQRTREALRAHWGGPKTFDSGQLERLVQGIRTY